MSLQNILNQEPDSLKEDVAKINQTIKDLVIQVNGTVQLIKLITDKHGKNIILSNMTEIESEIFNLVWSKIEEASEGTDFVMPTLIDKE